MTATTEAKPWDFSHVLDLVNSLSSTKDLPPVQSGVEEEQPVGASEDDESTNSRERKDFATASLGDFSRIWQFLGVPANSPAPIVQTLQGEDVEPPPLPSKEDYASDGAIYVNTSATQNTNQLWSEGESNEEQAVDTVSDGSTVPDTPTPTLTKSQRKKKNRRERRAQEAALAAESAAKKAPISVSESEADSLSRRTPAKKASAHVVTSEKRHYNLGERDASEKAITVNNGAPDVLIEATERAARKLEAAKKANKMAFHTRTSTTLPNLPLSDSQNGFVGQSSHATPLPQQNGNVSAYDAVYSRPAQQWSMSTPSHEKPTRFVPSTVQPSPSAIPITQYSTANQNSAPPKPAHVIEPRIVRSGEDRHWALLMKLIGDFWPDRKHLISPMNLTTHNNNPNGIHVFVDASNIFIGFNEQLKRSRGISQWVQVPPVNLSFDALALLMERRRPVAKRVLVGSTPHLPAFDNAKAVGYECNVLEKVYKARELTERQIFFKEHDRYGYRKQRAKAPPANNVPTANGSSVASGSGSETNAPQYAPARMIEQGVDEILHLKILESIVDTDVPGTIVLATGDAAQAEYSQGFMAMAERALKKGWTVELVSWSKNISAMYTRREWVEAWGQQFRIITLDDYAEELLDM